MQLNRLALLPIITASMVACPAAAPAYRWWSHVQFLADDRLEGRDTGSANRPERPTWNPDSFFRRFAQ